MNPKPDRADLGSTSSGNNTDSAVRPTEDPAQTPTTTEASTPSPPGFAQYIEHDGLLTQQIKPVAIVSRKKHSPLEVQKLSQVIGRALCHTELGQISLQRSLMRPGVDPQLARARREALREIVMNRGAGEAVANILTKSATDLTTVLGFTKQHLGERRDAAAFVATGDSLERLAQLSIQAPKFRSDLLKSTIEALRGFSESEAHRYFREGICLVQGHVRLCAEAPLIDRIFSRYLPGLIGPKSIAFAIGSAALAISGTAMQSQEALTLGSWLLGCSSWTACGKYRADPDLFFSPVAEILWRDPQFGRALTALGLLDELYARSQFPRYAAWINDSTQLLRRSANAHPRRNP